MGLFNFSKKAGADNLKKASADKDKSYTAKQVVRDEAAEREATLNSLRAQVQMSGAEVRNLNLELDDDRVTVSGQVASQADKEKILLTIGNNYGIAAVDDRMSVTNPAPESKFYEVKSGDTLSKIAKQQYGDANKYHAIFEANKPMLKDPDKIYPGQMLRIPLLN